MRIISGKFKSRLIRYPKTRAVRPMMDRVRESVFATLGEVVQGARVLDLYAGSGGLGLEALSRGAQSVLFVETLREAISVIRSNIEQLQVADEARVWPISVESALQKLEGRGEKFDLIFIDPPYPHRVIKKALMALDQSDILRPFGWAVVGHSKHESVPPLVHLKQLETKKFGEAHITFLIRTEREK